MTVVENHPFFLPIRGQDCHCWFAGDWDAIHFNYMRVNTFKRGYTRGIFGLVTKNEQPLKPILFAAARRHTFPDWLFELARQALMRIL